MLLDNDRGEADPQVREDSEWEHNEEAFLPPDEKQAEPLDRDAVEGAGVQQEAIEAGGAEVAEAGDAEVAEEHGVQQVQARRSSRTTAGKFKSVKFADFVVDIMLSDIFEDMGADDEHLFAMTLRKGLSERRPEALKVARAEIGQSWKREFGTQSWCETDGGAARGHYPILKDKYFASGAFEKFKARLVAGGNQQDKELYESLSSPTVSTSSVLAVAAIAANQSRSVWTCDIEGAYLNAPMKPTGVLVFMRLDPMLTRILVEMYPEYATFMQMNRTIVVQLDQALHGCVEASRLWFEHLTSTLTAGGYVQNPYDRCVFNRTDEKWVQLTTCLHVDDLLVTCCSDAAASRLFAVLERSYWES
jgi:hypothetical protein